MEEMIEQGGIENMKTIQEDLVKRLCKCMSSNHFQVAERSIFLLNNDTIMKMISQSKEILYPILLRSLLKNSKNHWNT
jgi:serine/threonine-protein phosphatase 2A regulatory subunit B'